MSRLFRVGPWLINIEARTIRFQDMRKLCYVNSDFFEFAKTRCDQLTQSRIVPGDITICMNQRIFDECKDLVSLPNDVIVWGDDDVDEHFTVHPDDEEIDQYAEQVFESIKKNVDILIQQHIS